MWLGHHSPAFTLEAYVHLLPDDLPDPTFLDEVTQKRRAVGDVRCDEYLLSDTVERPRPDAIEDLLKTPAREMIR
jgi:hypothetical protein